MPDAIIRAYKIRVEPVGGEKEERPTLPKFKPLKLSEISRTVTGKSALNFDGDLTIELLIRVEAQQQALFRALGQDPDNPDFTEAFLELARIHHGVGVVSISKSRPANKHAAKWSLEQDEILFKAMQKRLDKGMIASASLKEIAAEKAIWELLPSVKNSRSDKPAATRRAETYKKRWGFLKKKHFIENIPASILVGQEQNASHETSLSRTEHLENTPADLAGKSRS